MADQSTSRTPPDSGEGGERPDMNVRFADRSCPRCHSRFVASYYRGDDYVKSRCLDCMLFWPTPLMA